VKKLQNILGVNFYCC